MLHHVNRTVWLLLILLLRVGVTAQDRPFIPPIERHRFELVPVGNDWYSPAIPVRLGPSAPFLAAGHSWERRAGDRFTIHVRIATDGVTWEEWVPVVVDHDTLDTESAGGLTFIDPRARYLQYHLRSEADPLPDLIRVDLVNPGTTPDQLQSAYRRRMVEGPTENLHLRVGAPPRPPVVTRTEWGCPDGQVTSRPPVSYTTVTHLIVHHTVNNNSSADWAAVVRSIWNFHFYDRGYIDIGYNYLIDPNGVIYEGRSGGDNVLGAHFSGVNGGTMGIAMLGTFTAASPSSAAMESLRKLLAWKAAQRNLTPYRASLHTTSGMMLPIISGHRDGPGATECPGEALYRLLPRLRAEVHNQVNGAGYVAAVSAASYSTEAVAPGSIVAAFGLNLAATSSSATDVPLPERLAGTAVRIIDRLNREFTAPLFHVSPGQVNLLLPEGLAAGHATILIDNGIDNGPGGQVAAGSLRIETVAPGIFTANSDGQGTPAALLLRVRPDGEAGYEPVSLYDPLTGQQSPRRITFGPPSEQLFLVLFGTGLRGLSSAENVTAQLEDQQLPIKFLGPAPGLIGVDQVNVPLPPNLAGRGASPLGLLVDGKASNQVLLLF